MAPVRIPHSCKRREPTYATLIRRVRPCGTIASTFEGDYLRTGREVDDAGFPPVVLLHEHAGSAIAGRGHRRSTQLHILWRWDRERREWRELMRVQAIGSEWVEAMKHAALRELRDPNLSGVDQARAAAVRIFVLIDDEISLLERDAGRELVGMLWEQFAARFASV
jgi:hypothetical protein